MTLTGAPTLLLVAACALAWLRRLRPLARTLTALCALSALGWALEIALPSREIGAPPWTGWARVAFHTKQATVIGWGGVIVTGLVATLNRKWDITMGYCVEFEGRFTLDRMLTDEHAATLRKLEDEERDYPGDPPDDRFNPWNVSDDARGLEVRTDKPGDWKPWLQYTIDQFLAPWCYTLSGSVTWDGGERGDAGTITIENGRVMARRPPVRPWGEWPEKTRKHICRRIEDAANDDGRDDAWASALAHLGHTASTDRTEFDP